MSEAANSNLPSINGDTLRELVTEYTQKQEPGLRESIRGLIAHGYAIEVGVAPDGPDRLGVGIAGLLLFTVAADVLVDPAGVRDGYTFKGGYVGL
jgi:hypothetical protein